jgi:hypothetical protein
MLFGLVSVTSKRGSYLRIKLCALGWVQILPLVPDQHLFSLAYYLSHFSFLMIQGWVADPPKAGGLKRVDYIGRQDGVKRGWHV